jgi:hypothetical protein
VLVRTETEVLDSLAGVLGSSQQNNIASSRVSQSQLVQSQSLTTSLLDPGTGSSGESECGNVQFGDCEETVVICNGSDNSNCLVLVSLLGGLGLCLGDNARNRDGRTVDARLKKALKNDLVEVGVGATCALETVSFCSPLG